MNKLFPLIPLTTPPKGRSQFNFCFLGQKSIHSLYKHLLVTAKHFIFPLVSFFKQKLSLESLVTQVFKKTPIKPMARKLVGKQKLLKKYPLQFTFGRRISRDFKAQYPYSLASLWLCLA